MTAQTATIIGRQNFFLLSYINLLADFSHTHHIVARNRTKSVPVSSQILPKHGCSQTPLLYSKLFVQLLCISVTLVLLFTFITVESACVFVDIRSDKITPAFLPSAKLSTLILFIPTLRLESISVRVHVRAGPGFCCGAGQGC